MLVPDWRHAAHPARYIHTLHPDCPERKRGTFSVVSLTDQLPSTTCTNSTLLATLADFTEQIRNRVKNAEPLALDLRTTYTLVELFVGFREANATTPANSAVPAPLLQAVSMSAGIDATINALLESTL